MEARTFTCRPNPLSVKSAASRARFSVIGRCPIANPVPVTLRCVPSMLCRLLPTNICARSTRPLTSCGKRSTIAKDSYSHETADTVPRSKIENLFLSDLREEASTCPTMDPRSLRKVQAINAMTLMSEKIGQDAARRCDAKCYNAHHSRCHCICGGKNHGAGLQQAIDNVRDIFLPALMQHSERAGVDVPEFVRQLAGMKKGADRDRATQKRLFRGSEIVRTVQGVLF